uniref:Uncharacterized protein n=1 Tax=Rangifer tarandus platyrhynchus TaxID=3082113 RepID=A0ACB0FG44_RANTA|nr:unnamed protein product [Rangifer tarandus platyrhynchus]
MDSHVQPVLGTCTPDHRAGSPCASLQARAVGPAPKVKSQVGRQRWGSGAPRSGRGPRQPPVLHLSLDWPRQRPLESGWALADCSPGPEMTLRLAGPRSVGHPAPDDLTSLVLLRAHLPWAGASPFQWPQGPPPATPAPKPRAPGVGLLH